MASTYSVSRPDRVEDLYLQGVHTDLNRGCRWWSQQQGCSGPSWRPSWRADLDRKIGNSNVRTRLPPHGLNVFCIRIWSRWRPFTYKEHALISTEVAADGLNVFYIRIWSLWRPLPIRSTHWPPSMVPLMVSATGMQWSLVTAILTSRPG